MHVNPPSNSPASVASAGAPLAGAPSVATLTGASRASPVLPSQPASGPTTVAITLTQAPLPPANLWSNGTVLVALFALLGVLVTVWAAHWRMRRELDAAATNANAERAQSREEARLDREAAATEAHRERIATTRRQVYLEAVEALVKAQTYIGGLGGEDLSKLDYRSHVGPLTAAVGKVAVVGEMETVRVARELLTSLNAQLLRSMAMLVPLAGLNAEAEVHDREGTSAQTEMVRIVAAMRNHNETMKKDAAGFAALERSFDIERKRADDATKAAQAAHGRVVLAKMQYGSFMLGESRKLAMQLDFVVDGIRRELGITTDLEVMRAHTLQMANAAEEAYSELIRALGEFTVGGDAEGTVQSD